MLSLRSTALLFLTLVLLASTAHGLPRPQTDLVIIACRVDDLTGQPGRQNPEMAAKNWRDLEWHLNDSLEYECKRVVLRLEDSTPYQMQAQGKEIPLDADFSKHEQCAARAMEIGPRWNDQHKGWATMAIGCPTPWMSDNGTPDDKSDDFPTGSYKMPECPVHQPGTQNRIKCTYDESAI